MADNVPPIRDYTRAATGMLEIVPILSDVMVTNDALLVVTADDSGEIDHLWMVEQGLAKTSPNYVDNPLIPSLERKPFTGDDS